MEKKKCSKCNVEKNIVEFYFAKNRNSYTAECNSCRHLRINEYYLHNKDKKKKYSDKNKDKIHARQKEWHYKNKEYEIKYRNENKEKINFRQRNYIRNKKQTDSLYKLRTNISKLILISFKRGKVSKNSKTAQILNCTFEDFKFHIEKQFEPWMNWGNHGKYNPNGERTWQLDHIIPVSSAKTENELIKLNHYTNFQPLESMENILKSNRF